MPSINIGNFAAAGLNVDINPVEVPKDFHTGLKNVRMKAGGIIPFGGHQHITNTPAGFIPHALFFARTPNGDRFMIPGNNKIYAWDVGFTDITPAGMPVITEDDYWSAATLSGIPVICHPTIGPKYMDSASSIMKSLPWNATLTWATANQSCYIMVSHKQFLFALGVIDAGKDKFDGVRWSHPADVGAVPISWDPLDTTKSAGIVSLGGNGGRIIGGLSLRDSLVVYRENGINVFDYVGGIYVWRVRQMQTTAGLISNNAIVDVNGIHYFLSDSDILANDGNSLKSIASDRVRSLLSSISSDNYQKAFALHQSDTKEVWFCFPISNNLYSTIALVYNYQYDSWVVRDLPNVILAQVGSMAAVDSIWDNATDTWDGATKNWNDSMSNPFNTVTIGLLNNAPNYSLSILDSEIGFNSGPFTSIIERTDLLFHSIAEVSMINKAYMNVTGASTVSLQVGSQMQPGGPVYWKPAVNFIPNDQRKIDIRSTGCLHAYRVITNNVNTNFNFTGVQFDYVMAGRR